jgi:motility quorum-sensing regulator / GCU-specific mRNA interferase toxin
VEKAAPHRKLSAVKAWGRSRTNNAQRSGERSRLGPGLRRHARRCDGADLGRLPQEHDHARRSPPNLYMKQDVYRPMTPAGEVYLKLTVIDDVLIVSFKEL